MPDPILPNIETRYLREYLAQLPVGPNNQAVGTDLTSVIDLVSNSNVQVLVEAYTAEAIEPAIGAELNLTSSVDGTASTKINTLSAFSKTVVVDEALPIDASFTQSTPTNIDLNNGSLTPTVAATFKPLGEVIAGDKPIFFGDGAVDFNENSAHVNIGWFDGATLDEKWNFARRAFKNLFRYKIVLPLPSGQDRAAKWVISDGAKRYFWGLAAPLNFSDPENRVSIELNGLIQAIGPMGNMLVFSPDAVKTEDIEFTSKVEMDGANLVTSSGALYRGAARVNFSHLSINSVPYAVDVQSATPESFNYIDFLYAGQCSKGGFRADGGGAGNAINGFKVNTIQGAKFGPDAEFFVQLRGDTRNVNIGSGLYLADGGKVLPVGLDLVGTALGRPRWDSVGAFNGDFVEGVKARLEVGSSRMTGLSVGPIGGTPTTPNMVALDLEWVDNSSFLVAGSTHTGNIGLNCLRVTVNGRLSQLNKTGGSNTIVNGTMVQPLAINTRPALTDIMLGETIIDSTTGNEWLRTGNTGNAVTDLSIVGGIIRGEGSPEGVWAAPLGTGFMNRLGGTGATSYVKEAGAATSTGWVAK